MIGGQFLRMNGSGKLGFQLAGAIAIFMGPKSLWIKRCIIFFVFHRILPPI
jgi:hypothetical protein